MIFFAVSDIHGCFTQMIDALNEAGFNPMDDNHKLIVIGDAFDRGSENLILADYLVELDKLGKLIYVLGNHDLFLMDYVKGNVAGAIFNAQRNGMAKTVEQISGVKKQVSWFKWLEMALAPLSKHPIFNVLMDSELWFENDKFIYAHAGIANIPHWRDIMDNHSTWFRTDFMFGMDYTNTLQGKTLVVGHWHAYRLLQDALGHDVDIDTLDNHQSFTKDDGQMIAIDGCVNYSGIINVHIYDDGGK